MNIYLAGTLWVVGAALVTAAVAYTVRRFGTATGRAENNEAAGMVFTIVGGLHAVLIAFVLIGLFDGVNTASDSAYQEADGLVALTWAAEALPDPAREEIRELARDYATTVVQREWPVMAAGDDVDAVDDSAWSTLATLRTTVDGADASTAWQEERRTEAADQLWSVYEARQQRLNASAGDGVSTVMWFALVIGSVLSLALPMMLGGPRVRSHVVIVSVLAAAITMLIFAIQQLQNPFGGGASIGPEAFTSALDRLG
ncbi:DUF4239 domain-containing protein [Umezawaea beigongshangensis]|uniref:bestrophin-like domain n=1 Tax=Umezawaea beigongshangensis TaxID=2780383 RepID=UPI0018F1D6DF|nr:DUF4239 domain-containing protein [Umezawaea beigongshangensis]